MHDSQTHLHETILKYFQNKELDELYISFFLKSLAESFISIFIPIYLLTLGYKLTDVAIYYLIYFTTVSIVMPICMALNSRMGIKKTMSLGIFVLVIYFILLNFIDRGITYHLVASIFGISVALYYSAFHIEFTHTTKEKIAGRAVSVIRAIPIVTSIIGPFAGAMIISELSFTFLFVMVAIIIALSIIPIFFSRDYKVSMEKFSMKKIIYSDTRQKAFAYQASAALSLASGVFWPIFIYLALTDIVSVGSIVSMTSLASVFILMLIGMLVDREPKKALKMGVFTHAPFWILRLFLLTPAGLFISNYFSSMTRSIIDISFHKLVYEKAKKAKNIINYFLFREFNLEIGRIFIIVAAIIINSLVWIFVIAFFITFVYFVLIKEIKKEPS